MKTKVSILLKDKVKTAILVRPDNSVFIRSGDVIVVKYSKDAATFTTKVVKTWVDYKNEVKHIECTYVSSDGGE